jgi:DNA (cytosine-5)-methyltransferase 1
MMAQENPSYDEVLEKAFKQAQAIVANEKLDAELKKLKPQIANWIQTIVTNVKDCKYLYSILVTSFATKLVVPGQDIRKHQSGIQGGYSNRGVDQRYVTPFLKRHGLTHCAASGAESGRNFERPIPYALDFPSDPRGPGNREAFLHLIDSVQEKGHDPFPLIVFLFALDIKCNIKNVAYEYPALQGMPIQGIIDVFVEHFKAQGHNRSRLPVLAIYSIYKSLINEVERYKGKTLQPLEFHTTADIRSKKIGDIQVNKQDGTAFEGVEVKADLSFTEFDVAELLDKFQGQAVNRYYLLTTAEESIKTINKQSVNEKVKEVSEITGCQIIVNGIVPTLKYYLRLVTDPEIALKNYTQLIKEDQSVQEEHKHLWSDILKKHSSKSNGKASIS